MNPNDPQVCGTCHGRGAVDVRCAPCRGDHSCGRCEGGGIYTTGCPDCPAGARWGRIEGAMVGGIVAPIARASR